MTTRAQTQIGRVTAHPTAIAREIAELAEYLDVIRGEMLDATAQAHCHLEAVQPQHRGSAENLLNYLVLRQHDLRPLQARLSRFGLSSLGRSEGQVLSSVDAVRTALNALRTSGSSDMTTASIPVVNPDRLAANAQTLLGPPPAGRQVRIMVTMPSEAAHDYTLIHDLVHSGMDCMRINCAHDHQAAWAQMIEHLQRANRVLGRSCKIAMDLAGPKLRTGPLEPGPAVIKIKPDRDVYGRPMTPARVWLTPMRHARPAPSGASASLPVPDAWLHQLSIGDTVELTDARGARRALRIVDVNADGAWAEVDKTCYVVPGTALRRLGHKGKAASAAVGDIAPREEPIVLYRGDILVITRNRQAGRPATRDARGQVLTPASIACTLPEVFDDVRSGERIWLDDGMIGGVVQDIQSDRVIVKIDMARPGGSKLRSDKGINLPDSNLRLVALTAKDIEDLEFVARHADMISLSFVNRASDLEQLQEHLRRLHGEQLGIILKIETRRGFENLPELLLTSLRGACCGVMIARGDLAVECGFERLAELQEEILWICEAAHVPVIWATQVLENLAKDGVPSRAEITDAAMGERAECVMLNKGPHICEAVRVLDDILRRMQAHVSKKRSMLRELKLAQRFLQPANTDLSV
jgi:pyruvate kinase